HLDRVKSAPRDPKHSYIPVGPRLMGEPCDYLLSVALLLFGILAVSRSAFTVAKTADVDTRADISSTREVCVFRIVAGGHGIIFSVGQVVEQGGKLFARLCAVRHV